MTVVLELQPRQQTGIDPIIGEWKLGYRKIGMGEVVLIRLRIDHSKITHNNH